MPFPECQLWAQLPSTVSGGVIVRAPTDALCREEALWNLYKMMIVTGSGGRTLGEVMRCLFMVMMRVVLWGLCFWIGGWPLCARLQRPPRGKYAHQFIAVSDKTNADCGSFQGLRRHCGSPHTYNDDRVLLLLGISPKAVRYKFTTCQERFFFSSSIVLDYFCLFLSHVLPAAAPCREGSGECLRQVSPSHLCCCLGIW